MAVVTKGLGLFGDAFEGAIRSAREVYDDLSVEEIYKHLTDERYGKGRVGELERMQNLVTRKNKTGNFAGNPISIADLEGRGFITSMADRSDAGGLLTHIKGVELETPIDLLGGQGFMFNNQEAWAQAQGAGSGIKNVGKKLRKTTGQNPILIPNRMAPTGGDFAGFNGEAMLSFAQSNMTGKQKDLLNKQMKKLIPSWKGIDSPTSLNDFQALPKVGRNAVMNMLDTKFRNNGGLSIGEGRLATTEAGQINAPDTRIQNIAELDLDAPMGLVSHPAYTHGMAGRGLGTIKEDVPAYALNPQSVKEMNAGFNRPVADVFNPTPQDVRSLQMGAKGGIITEGLLRRLDDLGVLGSTAIGTGGLLASMNSQAGVGGGLKNIMPAPQRMFDPTDKKYKPFLSDFDQVAGGRFLEMGGPDGPVDVTGRYPATANISVSPDGKPTFQVSGEERTGLPPNKGRSIKTNLFKKSAGWKWTKVPEGFDPNPAGNFPIISVEDGNKHYYTLDAQFPDGAELARYPDKATEPRLRPTRKGSLELGNKVGEIKSRGNIHPVYDKAVIREGAAGATALAALASSNEADAGQYDPTSMSGVLGISPEMIEAMAQRDALDQQRMSADEQRYGQYADDQMMPREQTYSEQLGNYLSNLRYGDDSDKQQQEMARVLSGILDFTPVGSADALKLGAQQREAGNSFEGWLNSIGGAAEAAIPLAGLGYKYGKKGVQGLMGAF